jgi:hypothetical protein
MTAGRTSCHILSARVTSLNIVANTARPHYSGWRPQHRNEKNRRIEARRQCVKYGSKHKFSCLTTHCASLILRFHSNGTTHARRQQRAPSTTSGRVITRNSKNLETVPSKQFGIPRHTQNPADYNSCTYKDQILA